MTELHPSQRGYFSGALYDAMKADDSIYLIIIDLGYKTFDRCFHDFPDRCINTGASEQAAMGIAVGLALSGKIPFIFTITSFFLRCAETISLYIEHEKIPVRMVGAGRDDDYLHDGYSHFAYKAQEYIHSLKIAEGYPETKEQVPDIIKFMVENNVPSFISLKR